MNAVVQLKSEIRRTHVDILLDRERLNLEERFLAWEANREILGPIVDELHPIAVSVGYPSTLDFSISGDKEVLLKAIRCFRKNKFSTQNSPPAPGENSWSAFFGRPGCSIRIWFSFTSTVCRRVKVGTKMVPQDVYETVCGPMPDAIELQDIQPEVPQIETDDVPF